MPAARRRVGETGPVGSEANIPMIFGAPPHRRRHATALVAVSFAFGFCLSSLAQETSPTVSGKPVAIKVLEIGRVSDWRFSRAMKRFPGWSDCSVQFYTINYGSDREIARRESLILKSMPTLRVFDCSRRSFVRGGLGRGPKTVVWKIPPGADNPEP